MQLQLSRPKTVKGIWKHIKENDLQNPEDKRMIMCDDALRAIFKKDSVHMFTMVSQTTLTLHFRTLHIRRTKFFRVTLRPWTSDTRRSGYLWKTLPKAQCRLERR